MKKTVVGIFSYAAANAIVARHWPYYCLSDAALWGIGRIDSKCEWPKGLYAQTDIGRDGYVGKGNLCQRLVDAMSKFAFGHELKAFSDLCLIECDAIFTRALPNHPGGLVTHYAGAHSDGFLSTRYFHTPWWVDRETASLIAGMGQWLLNHGMNEHDFPDRFMGLVCDRCPEIKIHQPNSFSVNLLDTPELMTQARDAITKGAYYVHGVKTAQQLGQLTWCFNLFAK